MNIPWISSWKLIFLSSIFSSRKWSCFTSHHSQGPPTHLLAKVIIFRHSGGPPLTFLRKWSFFVTHMQKSFETSQNSSQTLSLTLNLTRVIFLLQKWGILDCKTKIWFFTSITLFTCTILIHFGTHLKPRLDKTWPNDHFSCYTDKTTNLII